MRSPVLALLLFAFATACAAPHPQAAPTARTAPLLLAALDGEALFTIAGGLKPVSEGFWHTRVEVESPDLAEVRAVREALAPWRTDSLWADVHVFHEAHEGKRFALAWVCDRRALAELLRERADFFAPYGLAPDTHPCEVIAVVERMPRADRHRGQGLLFGYPQHAIDFFVEADEKKQRGEPVPERRFVNLPTHGSEKGRFVYAVAKDAEEQPRDRELAEAAAIRLSRYRELRAGASAPEAAVLLEWTERLQREFAPVSAR